MADDSAHPDRAASPQLWASPTLPIGAVPGLDRSVSTASTSSSSISGMSAGSRRSWGGVPNGRRGYMRPEGTSFADSAKNRESVMSLGTIAHLQYYFARTGLLDDKGGRIAKETKRKKSSNAAEGVQTTADRAHEAFLDTQGDSKRSSCAISDDGYLSEGATDIPFVESPVGDDETETHWEFQPAPMLPPTVSTYKNKVLYTPPPPDIIVLRRELREALEDARRVLAETERPEMIAKYKRKAAQTEKMAAEAAERRKQDESSGNSTPEAEQEPLPQPQGWTEIQGLHVLDSVTLAIRAAKNYYTAHEQPERLYSIKPEKTIRKELYQVLEFLKRMAGRDFEGGIRDDERQGINGWIDDIKGLLDAEQAKEQAEEAEREKWSWREGDWTGREREREWLFLKSFDQEKDELPPWTDPNEASELPTPFLQELHSGIRLVRLHNTLVRKSRRQFEEIKSYHKDTSLPYRCAENLRFWIKAAELRWEIKLKVDVMEVVHGESADAWKAFDKALLKWCKGVREEITAEWKQQRLKSMVMPPTLRIDTDTGVPAV